MKTFDEIDLQDRNITSISVDGDTLVIESFHRSHIECVRVIAFPVTLTFKGVASLRFRKRDRSDNPGSYRENLPRVEWDAGYRNAIESMFEKPGSDYNADCDNHPGFMFLDISLESFMVKTTEVQAKARIPMGVADVYHKNDYVQIDMHTDLRLQFTYSSFESVVSSIPATDVGRMFTAGGASFVVAD